MTTAIIRFLNILFAALVTGTVFGIFIGFNPIDFSAGAYIEHQQVAIKNLNVLMPVLGLITILLTGLHAFLQRKDKSVLYTLLVALLFLILSGLITRFGNQPINSIVMTLNSTSPPDNWMQLRDEWWTLHTLRMCTLLISLTLIIWSSIKRSEP